MTNGGMQFDVAPIWSSSEGIARDGQTLFSYAEDDSNGSSRRQRRPIYIRAMSGGVTMVTSNALTFSAHRMLDRHGRWQRLAPSRLQEQTTGNGHSDRRRGPAPQARRHIGNRQGAAQPAFVRLGRYINAA